MENSRVQQIIEQQKKAFEEIIFKMTDPSLKPGDRLKRLSMGRERAKSLLDELTKQYRALPEASEDQLKEKLLLKDFIISINDKYKSTVESEANKAIGEEPIDIKTNNKVSSLNTINKKEFSTMNATEYIDFNDSIKLNLALGINLENGEENISTTDLFFVIEPFTKSGLVNVIKFSSVDTLTKFLHDNYKKDTIQPIIIKGKQAKLNYSINIEL